MSKSNLEINVFDDVSQDPQSVLLHFVGVLTDIISILHPLNWQLHWTFILKQNNKVKLPSTGQRTRYSNLPMQRSHDSHIP